MIQTQDGSLVATGYTESYGLGSADLLLAKFAENGTLIWAQTLGGTSSDLGYSVIETQEGSLVATGRTNSYGSGNADLLLAKFAANGDLTWAKTLGGTGSDYGHSVIETADGSLVATGWTASYGAGSADWLLAKFAANGDLTWAKALGGTSWDYGYSVIETADGSLVVTGYTNSYGAGSTDLLLAKFAANGDLTWAKTLGGTNSDGGESVIETQEGSLVATGWTDSYGAGNRDLLLAKFAENGTLTWAQTLGGTSSDRGSSVIETAEGGLVVKGGTTNYGAGSWDLLLAKFDESNPASCFTAITPNYTDITANISLTTLATDGLISDILPNVTDIHPEFSDITPNETLICLVSDAPTYSPSGYPSRLPTRIPSSLPSLDPSYTPTAQPSSFATSRADSAPKEEQDATATVLIAAGSAIGVVCIGGCVYLYVKRNQQYTIALQKENLKLKSALEKARSASPSPPITPGHDAVSPFSFYEPGSPLEQHKQSITGILGQPGQHQAADEEVPVEELYPNPPAKEGGVPIKIRYKGHPVDGLTRTGEGDEVVEAANDEGKPNNANIPVGGVAAVVGGLAVAAASKK